MVLLDGAGLLNEKFIAAVDTFDLLLTEGNMRLDHALQSLDASSTALDGLDDDDDE